MRDLNMKKFFKKSIASLMILSMTCNSFTMQSSAFDWKKDKWLKIGLATSVILPASIYLLYNMKKPNINEIEEIARGNERIEDEKSRMEWHDGTRRQKIGTKNVEDFRRVLSNKLESQGNVRLGKGFYIKSTLPKWQTVDLNNVKIDGKVEKLDDNKLSKIIQRLWPNENKVGNTFSSYLSIGDPVKIYENMSEEEKILLKRTVYAADQLHEKGKTDKKCKDDFDGLGVILDGRDDACVLRLTGIMRQMAAYLDNIEFQSSNANDNDGKEDKLSKRILSDYRQNWMTTTISDLQKTYVRNKKDSQGRLLSNESVMFSSVIANKYKDKIALDHMENVFDKAKAVIELCGADLISEERFLNSLAKSFSMKDLVEIANAKVHSKGILPPDAFENYEKECFNTEISFNEYCMIYGEKIIKSSGSGIKFKELEKRDKFLKEKVKKELVEKADLGADQEAKDELSNWIDGNGKASIESIQGWLVEVKPDLKDPCIIDFTNEWMGVATVAKMLDKDKNIFIN